MVKSSSTNSAFFKTGGRLAAAHETIDRGDQKPLTNRGRGAKMQGKEGQPNFIPGEAPVGPTSRAKAAKKK